MARVGLGRRERIADAGDTGDPLEGVVNLFDIGIVVAAAALVAALAATAKAGDDRAEPTPATSTTPLTAPRTSTPRASGPGESVGTVYRLPDGRLVLVEPDG